MQTSSYRTLFALLLFVPSYGTASAATLTTPLVLTATGILCAASNLSTKPLDITVTVTDSTGAVLAPSTDTCNGTKVAPGASCNVIVSSVPGPLTGGICTFTGNKKFRGVGYGSTGATLNIVVPATK